MRVRVRFRYRADTGEVELFQVDDLGDGSPEADHDARHDRATADVARVVVPNPLVEEVLPGIASATESAGDGAARDGAARDGAAAAEPVTERGGRRVRD